MGTVVDVTHRALDLLAILPGAGEFAQSADSFETGVVRRGNLHAVM